MGLGLGLGWGWAGGWVEVGVIILKKNTSMQHSQILQWEALEGLIISHVEQYTESSSSDIWIGFI